MGDRFPATARCDRLQSGHGQTRATPRGSGALTVTVSDTGVGIPPEHLPPAFKPFYRADPSRAGDRPGAGLGLAICHSIVRTLGGSINFENTPGRQHDGAGRPAARRSVWLILGQSISVGRFSRISRSQQLPENPTEGQASTLGLTAQKQGEPTGYHSLSGRGHSTREVASIGTSRDA